MQGNTAGPLTGRTWLGRLLYSSAWVRKRTLGTGYNPNPSWRAADLSRPWVWATEVERPFAEAAFATGLSKQTVKRESGELMAARLSRPSTAGSSTFICEDPLKGNTLESVQEAVASKPFQTKDSRPAGLRGSCRVSSPSVRAQAASDARPSGRGSGLQGDAAWSPGPHTPSTLQVRMPEPSTDTIVRDSSS